MELFKNKKLIYAVYSLTILILTFYFSVLILEGYFDDLARKTRKTFIGHFVRIYVQISEGKYNYTEFFEKLNEVELLDDEFEYYITCVRYNLNNEPFEFKDYCYPLEKPNNTIRIVALGDSFTEGWVVLTNDSWPNQLEKKLNAIGDINYEVLNFGFRGFNTEDEVRVFKEYAILYDPDIVILQFFDNDVENNTWVNERTEQMFQEYLLGLRDLPEELEQSNHSEKDVKNWFRHLASLEERYMLISNGYKEVWKHVEIPLIDLINLTKERDIKLIVFDFDKIDDYYTSMPQRSWAFKSMSEKYDFMFLSFVEYFDQCDNEEIRMRNNRHFNAKGYDILSDKIIEYAFQS